MKALPKINALYWQSLIVASILGINTGDFVSGHLHFGHLEGLIFLAGLLIVIFVAEKVRSSASALYFWAAIITIRTAATNIGDAFHGFGIHFNISLPLVGLIFAASVLVYRRVPTSGTRDDSSIKVTPAYWVCMALVGVLGTIGGDFVSFGLRLMPAGAALVCGFVVGIMLYWGRNGRFIQPVYYWALLAMIMTAGTAAGDFLAHRVFGLPLSTAVMGVIFIGMVVFFYSIKKVNQIVSASN
jgi:uncharacterized membrane-anchored protein